MKAAVYIRVSTEEQHVENQLLQIKELAKAKRWQIVKVYAEEETAWKAGHQHQLAQAFKDASQSRFQILIIWALDRLSRQGALDSLLVVTRFSGYGVEIESLKESWLRAGMPFRDTMIAMYGDIARYESERRSDRTKAGLARTKAAGTKLGRPKGSTDKKKRRQRFSKKRPPNLTPDVYA